MPVFIKRSGSGGGLIASGEIAELPAMFSDVEQPQYLGEELWHENHPEGIPRVGIKLHEVRLTLAEGMLPTSKLAAIPELAGRPLAEAPRGTVFRLSTEHLAAIWREWGGFPYSGVGGHQTGAAEGLPVLRIHYERERRSWIVAEKKRRFREQHGRLFCEVCKTDYEEKYGELWNERVIEAHHLIPFADLENEIVTRFEDLLLICSNCHRLVHQDEEVSGNLERLLQRFSG